MPKPTNPGNGNGGGSDDGGDSIAFAILGLQDDSDSGVSQTDDLTNVTSGFTITGTIDPSITSFTIRFTVGDFVFEDTVTDVAADGSWSYTYQGNALPEGTVLVEAEYEELHKNGKTMKTVAASSYSFEIDTTADVVITAAEVAAGGGLVLTGTADAGAAVYLYLDDGTGSLVEIGTTTADEFGNWQLTDSSYTGGDATYVATDAAGNTDAAGSFTYTETGNSPATIGGDTTGDVTEDTALNAGGTLTVSDDDAGEDGLQSTSGGAYGTFTVQSGGTWTYALDNTLTAVQALGQGDTLTDQITVTSIDGSATETLVVTITGTNDVPTITGTTTGDVSEDGTLQVGGALIVDDVDTGESGLQTVAGGAGTYGTFDIADDDTWTYTLNNDDPAVQALAEGQEVTDTFTVTSLDGSATKTLTVTITGTNDVPEITGLSTGDVTEDDAQNGTATGSLVASDTDTGESSFQAQSGTAGTYGSFQITSTGSWAYSIDNTKAAVQALAEGEQQTDSFVVWSADGSASETVVITVTGANDAASIDGEASGSVTEDAATATAQGTLTVTDPDAGEDAPAVVAAGAATVGGYGTYEVKADGTWIYTLDNSHADVQALAAGEWLVDSFTVTSLDGTASQTVTITINGADEPPPPSSGGSIDPSDDPLYVDQWHLTYLGNLEAVWEDFGGFGASVGVYDNGIDYTHPDLYANYDPSKHVWVDGEQLDPAPSDTVTAEHGTAVSGIIAAVDNTEGGVGVAPGASLTGVNIFGGPADVNGSDISGFQEAINQAHTFDIINNSWGQAPDFNHENAPATLAALDGFETASLTGRGGLGTIIVKAAGNSYDNAQTALNASRYTIAVAAHDQDADASWYTNRGANLLVSAPSSGSSADGDSGILTTDEQGSEGYAAGDYTYGFGGTSAAAPVVSGVVALMLEANPNLGARDVQTILAYSAHFLGGDPNATAPVPADSDGDGVADTTVEFPVEFFHWFRNGASDWNGGGLHFSEDYGFGGVNAFNAVRMAEVWSLFAAAQTFGDIQAGGNEVIVEGAAQTPGLAFDNAWVESSFTYTQGMPEMELEYVEVYVDFTAGNGQLFQAGNMKEIALELVSPSGTVVSLIQPVPYGTSGPDAYKATNDFLPEFPGQVTWTYGVNAFRGEEITGDWTVRIRDVFNDEFGGGDGGTLNEFQLNFYGAAPDDNDVYHYTDEVFAELALDPARLDLWDDAGADDWLNMAAMTEDLTVSLASDGTGGASAAVSGSFIEISSGTTIENAVTGDGNDILFGNDADNELAGRRGDDIYWGGAGADVFIFYAGDGNDWIMDFEDGGGTEDVIALYGFGFSSTSDFVISDNSVDTLLDFGTGDTIMLAGIGDSSTIGDDDFLFV